MAEECDQQSTAGAPDASTGDLQSQCDADFARYDRERGGLVTAERETERNYDALLVTISTLAIASSFTIFKDFISVSSASALAILAWCSLGLCLLVALADRLLSYTTHKRWREILDAEFANWRPGIWKEVLKKYPEIPLIWLLPYLKWAGFILLSLGLVFLLLIVVSAPKAPLDEKRYEQPPVVVNVFNGAPPAVTSQPTTNLSATNAVVP